MGLYQKYSAECLVEIWGPLISWAVFLTGKHPLTKAPYCTGFAGKMGCGLGFLILVLMSSWLLPDAAAQVRWGWILPSVLAGLPWSSGGWHYSWIAYLEVTEIFSLTKRVKVGIRPGCTGEELNAEIGHTWARSRRPWLREIQRSDVHLLSPNLMASLRGVIVSTLKAICFPRLTAPSFKVSNIGPSLSHALLSLILSSSSLSHF